MGLHQGSGHAAGGRGRRLRLGSRGLDEWVVTEWLVVAFGGEREWTERAAARGSRWWGSRGAERRVNAD